MAATFFGVVPSVVGGGILTLIVVGATAALAPQLRRLDLGRRMIEGPGATPQAGPAATDGVPRTVQAAAEVERVAGGELGGEGASVQG